MERRLDPNWGLFFEETTGIISPLPSEDESENEDEILPIEEKGDDDSGDNTEDELILPNDEREELYGKDGQFGMHSQSKVFVISRWSITALEKSVGQ